MNFLTRNSLSHIRRSLVGSRRVPYCFYHSDSTTHPTYNDTARLRIMEEKYATNVSTPIPKAFDSIYRNIVEDTIRNFPGSFMMVGFSQAQFLHHMVKILRPSSILEIGGFTGASAVAMGSALDFDGKLLSLEKELDAIQVAKKHIDTTALREKVYFKEGLAIDSLLELSKKVPKPQFDLIFLDADKSGYITYYNCIMENDLLSDKGLILVDNVLLYGQVHRQAGYDESQPAEASPLIKKEAKSLTVFNKHVHEDSRSEVVLLPLYDGISLIRKKQ